ncbi:hypothetical protein ACGFYP_18605 [Streptomyces sp. NPDC048370]|uniref:hypothetical protein n=1 Tax=Streptomyces sp. NPDC048370 TaxID=3365540 RepID=UPI003711B103
MGMGKALSYLGAVVVPLGTGALLYLWADGSLGGGAGTPTAIAVLVGLALTVAALVAHNALFREGGSCLGALLMVAGLAAVWVEVRDSTTRDEVVACVVVGKVRVTHYPTFGEGAPRPKTLFHHPLDCPGGYPSEFGAEEKVADEGGKVRIAYDSARRMDPVLESENVPRGSPWIPAALLTLAAAASVVAIAREAPEGRVDDRGRR